MTTKKAPPSRDRCYSLPGVKLEGLRELQVVLLVLMCLSFSVV